VTEASAGPALPPSGVINGGGAEGAAWDCHVHVFDDQSPVKPGHYAPEAAPLSQVEVLAQDQGVHHLVLVQPSVYGSDNRLLLRALANTPGRHRGVVVLEPGCTEAELGAMQRAGVRAARLNLVSPVGESIDEAHIEQRFRWLAPRLAELGWHVQWYCRPEQLPLIERLHSAPGSPVAVLDHLAGLTANHSLAGLTANHSLAGLTANHSLAGLTANHSLAGLTAHHPSGLAAWRATRSLADQGAWVKLSGWYRLGSSAPHADLAPLVSQLAAVFAERMVWGSDWPHTAFARAHVPPYASTWAPVVGALGLAAAQQLRSKTPAIYR
jgi:predicted TIM-barrel fold metal-dependent hydrolase